MENYIKQLRDLVYSSQPVLHYSKIMSVLDEMESSLKPIQPKPEPSTTPPPKTTKPSTTESKKTKK